MRMSKNSSEVKAQWKVFDDKEPSLENLHEFNKDIPDIVREFLQKLMLPGNARQWCIEQSLQLLRPFLPSHNLVVGAVLSIS